MSSPGASKLPTRLVLSLLAAALAGCSAVPAPLSATTGSASLSAAAAAPLNWNAIYRALDVDRDKALSPAELGLDEAQFAALDRDADGRVAPAEWNAEVGADELARKASAFAPMEEATRRLGAPVTAMGDPVPERGPLRWLLDRYVRFGSHVAMSRAIYPRRQKIEGSPAKFGLAYENVSFKTEDGLLIKGWYIPAAKPTTRSVLLMHGQQSQRGEFVRCGQLPWLHPEYNQLVIDLRNNGESEGTFTTFGYHEAKDAIAAVRYLRQRGNEKVAAYGVSMGGATAIRAAALGAEIDAVIDDCAFSTMLSVFKGGVAAASAPFSTLIAAALLTRANEKLGIDLTEGEPAAMAPGVAPRPFFVIHGEKDPVVTWDNSKLNYLAAGTGLVKDLWIVPGAGHGVSMVHARDAYRERVLTFLRQNM